jgi:AcrR family transcriptional regulator
MPKETFFNLKEEKQERILRCAISEFRGHGFSGANVGTIAGSAGVAKGSMYQYFYDKNELFTYCVKWAISYLMDKVNPGAGAAAGDMFEYFSSDISAGVRLVREEKDLAFFTQDVFLGKFKPMPDDTIAEMMRIADDYTLKMIRAEQARGNIRSDIDEELLKIFILGACLKIKEHVLLEAEKAGFDISDERMENFKVIVENMVDMLKNGIGNKGK